jgi:hypothetical protein
VAGDTFSLRLPDELYQRTGERQERYEKVSLAAQVREDLETYAALLRAELGRIPLTLAEARALSTVCPARATQQVPGPLLAGLLADAMALWERRDRTWGEDHGVDPQPLFQRLVALGPTADLALRDAFLRWHQSADRADTKASFTACDLHIL